LKHGVKRRKKWAEKVRTGLPALPAATVVFSWEFSWRSQAACDQARPISLIDSGSVFVVHFLIHSLLAFFRQY
jgi:hypothetical protein